MYMHTLCMNTAHIGTKPGICIYFNIYTLVVNYNCYKNVSMIFDLHIYICVCTLLCVLKCFVSARTFIHFNDSFKDLYTSKLLLLVILFP